MILVYDTPWWVEAGLCGLSQSFTGPFTVTRDTSDAEKGHFSLTCFVVGEPGRQWSKLHPHERRAQVLSQVAEVFGHRDEVYKPREVFEQEWVKEQWSKGCPCPVMPPGVMEKLGSALREPVGNLHFVGTETSYEWKGYMEGAVRSGERGAKEVVDALSKEPRS